MSTFTIASSVPGPAATGYAGQGHIRYAANQGAFWVFYLSSTQGLASLYSTNTGSSWSAPTGSPITLAEAHLSEGRNFAFGYNNLASTDVLHILSAYQSSSSHADVYHARTTLGTTWSVTNAETQYLSTFNPGASYPSGGCCEVLANSAVLDECSYVNGNAGSAGYLLDNHQDAGTSWTAGLVSTLNTPASATWWNGSATVFYLGSNTAISISDNCSSNVSSSNTGCTNLLWSKGTSVTVQSAASWGSGANVFGSSFTATLPGNWGACARTTSDVHVVALTDNGATGTYSHARFNGTSWSAGDTIPNDSYGTNSNIAVVTDGTNVWAAHLDSSGNLRVSEWISGTGWGSWTTKAAVGANSRAYLIGAYDGTANIVWAWTETASGPVYSIVGTAMATSASGSFTATPGAIPKGHSGHITLTLAGVGTSWAGGGSQFSISGVSGASKVSENVTSTTAATLVVTTGSGTGTLTISDGTNTNTVTVGAPSFTLSPNSGAIGTTPTVTATGTNTVWSQETASTLFSLSGGTGASISSISVSTNTSATFHLTVGSATGTLTITDAPTSDTASFTAANATPHAYTSQRAGDWNVASGTSTSPWYDNGTQSSWNSIPAATNGDTAAIDHAVTMTADSSIGDGTNSTVLTVGTVGASITATGCKFSIRGLSSWGASNGGNIGDYLILNTSGSTPAILELDANSGVTPVVTSGFDCRFVSNGTSSATNIVRTKSGSAGNNGYFTNAGNNRSGYWYAPYTEFQRLGSSSQAGITASIDSNSTWSNPTHQTAVFSHCLFDTCGTIPSLLQTAGADGTMDVSFTNCTWQNSLASVSTGCFDLNFSGFAISGAGVRLVDSCIFLNRPAFDGPRDFTITNNYFDDGINVAPSVLPWASFDGNFVRFQTETELILGGTQTNSYLYGDPAWSGAGSKLFLTSEYGNTTQNGANGTGGNITGNVVEWAGTGTIYAWGETEGSPASIDRPMVFTFNLTFSSGGGSLIGCAVNSNIANSYKNLSTFEHNTFVVNASDALNGALTTGIQANSIQAIKSNIFYNTGSSTGVYAFEDTDSAPVADSVPASAIGYNCWKGFATQPSTYWTVTHPVSGATTCSDGTVYLTPESGATAPGAHDVANTDPSFVDNTRTLATWSTHKGGPGTAADALSRIQSSPGLTKTDLLPWIKAGYAPSNVALHSTAHDGGDIGAIAYQPGGATAYTLTAPGTAKGDLTVASGNFTVQCNGTPGSSVTITPSDGGNGGTFTPTSLTISDSSTHTFTYTPVKWGSRTISTSNNGGLTDPSSVTYLAMVQLGSSGTAPSGNQAPALGGYDIFANGTWLPEFKRNTTGDSADANSSAVMGRYTGSPDLYTGNVSTTTANGGNSLYGMPINIVPGTQATKTVTAHTYWAVSDVDQTTHQASVPVPAAPSIQSWYDAGGAFPSVSGGGTNADNHMLIAVRNETTGGIDTIWEFYKAYTTTSGSTWECEGLAKFDIAGGTTRLEGNASSDAAGLCIFPLLLKYEEAQAGTINHRLLGTFSNYLTGSRFTWPGRAQTSQNGTSTTYMMYGATVRLTSAWYTANVGSYSGRPLTVVNALHNYGLIHSDGSGFGLGTGATIEGVNDQRWTTSDFTAIGTIPMSAFEVITQNPGYTLTGPTSGAVGVAQTFTLTKYPSGDSNYSGNVYATANGSSTGISSSPVTLADATPSGTFTFTPPSAGTYTIAGAHGNDQWLDAPPITFTALAPTLTLTPASQSVAVNTAASLTATLTNASGSLSATTTGGTLSTASPTSGTPFTLTTQSSGSGTDIVTVTGPGGLSATAYVNYPVPSGPPLILWGEY